MLVRSKFFSPFVEEIEKFILSLPKQHNKMLKFRSEMLKIKKNGKIIKRGKISRKIPRTFGISGIFRDPEKFFENFSFSGKLKIRKKGKS